MSSCKFPEHHASGGGGSGAAGVLLLAVVAGAVVATHLAAVLIGLAVAAGLAVTALVIRAAVRSSRSAPYDTAWHDSAQDKATVPGLPVYAQILQARVEQVERQLAERAVAGVIGEPQQHVHFHGLEAAHVAEMIASRAVSPAEQNYPHVTSRPALPERPESLRAASRANHPAT